MRVKCGDNCFGRMSDKKQSGSDKLLAFAQRNTVLYLFPSTERREFDMKKDIHPNYEDATITCACNNVINTRSTKKAMTVNTCSACHPYFTGQQTMLDTEGRVDQFRKRYSVKKA